ncbi:MAG TPA: chorismate mutase [Candidatus Angelobacter sp.]|nr:chorismate mutase [Candidatus Angelobacter sp.]
MNQRNGSGNKVRMLQERRREIDRLDAELIRLLNSRAKIACELGVIKVAVGLPAYDARREREVLARIRAQSSGPLEPAGLTRIFRRIILETRRIGKWSMQQERDRYRHTGAGKGNFNGN